MRFGLLKFLGDSGFLLLGEYVADDGKRDGNQEEVLQGQVTLDPAPILDHSPENLYRTRNDVVGDLNPALRLLPGDAQRCQST